MGSDPAAAVVQIAARVVALVDAQDGTELVTTIAGGMRLGDYLPHADVRAGRPHSRPRHGARRAAARPRYRRRAGAAHCRRPCRHRRPRRPASACRHRSAGPTGGLLGALTPPHRNPALRAAYGPPIQPRDAADPTPAAWSPGSRSSSGLSRPSGVQPSGRPAAARRPAGIPQSRAARRLTRAKPGLSRCGCSFERRHRAHR